MAGAENIIEVSGLSIGYGGAALLENLNFEVRKGEIFAILGGSGCGKSTLLKHLIGLYRPLSGDIMVYGENIAGADEDAKRLLMRRFGVTYQGGALFGSMTVRENVAFPLEEFSDLPPSEIDLKVMDKLKMVGLESFADYMPAELSGGMAKRAGLARALALDPKLLFFDEPSAGLDPITSAGLDRRILALRDDYGATVILVTHELDSVFSIADRVIVLDRESRGIVDSGDPRELRSGSKSELVRRFLSRDGMDGEHYCNAEKGV